jgi:hypothetical protein
MLNAFTNRRSCPDSDTLIARTTNDCSPTDESSYPMKLDSRTLIAIASRSMDQVTLPA